MVSTPPRHLLPTIVPCSRWALHWRLRLHLHLHLHLPLPLPLHLSLSLSLYTSLRFGHWLPAICTRTVPPRLLTQDASHPPSPTPRSKQQMREREDTKTRLPIRASRSDDHFPPRPGIIGLLLGAAVQSLSHSASGRLQHATTCNMQWSPSLPLPSGSATIGKAKECH
jgi:hypothetical protein